MFFLSFSLSCLCGRFAAGAAAANCSQCPANTEALEPGAQVCTTALPGMSNYVLVLTGLAVGGGVVILIVTYFLFIKPRRARQPYRPVPSAPLTN